MQYAMDLNKWSLLSWERGLKSEIIGGIYQPTLVAPLVGAWIEIALPGNIPIQNSVAPLVGAWIEIRDRSRQESGHPSLLSWERGLK